MTKNSFVAEVTFNVKVFLWNKQSYLKEVERRSYIYPKYLENYQYKLQELTIQ